MNMIRLLAIITLLAPLPGAAAEVNTVLETSFESSLNYRNPFTDLEVDVFFSKGEKQWKVPACWDGGRTWKVRFAPPEEGEYTYRTIATDQANPGLNTGKQTLTVTEYRGDNPLYKHGKLQVTDDQRHFEFADGTRESCYELHMLRGSLPQPPLHPTMKDKPVLCPRRLRRVPRQFSWIDQRLVRDGHIRGRSPEALGLYLLLCTVAPPSWHPRHLGHRGR